MLILFHNIQFISLFVVVFAIYWGLPTRFRNVFLLLVSYGFYASWDWRFSGLLLLSTVIDYTCGLSIENSRSIKSKRIILILSLSCNLGLLCFFKYCNFFIESLDDLFQLLGLSFNIATMQIILPLGISFYTFQTMSYSIDIYRGKLKPTRNFIDFALFVSFFPQLLAGPIEKARDLLPQLIKHKFLKQIEWKRAVYLYFYGWFLKTAVAGSMGLIANHVFSMEDPAGSEVMLGIYAFSLQIYGDFAGYSKMARGLAHFFGIRLSTNFRLPFFSSGYVDFYTRWHITLGKWIGEYVYTPLYYALPKTRLLSIINSTSVRLYLSAAIALFVTRMAFAFWHGANYTFLYLGIYIYIGQILSITSHRVFKNIDSFNFGWPARLKRPVQSLIMVNMFALAMLFFRAENGDQVCHFLIKLFTDFQFSILTSYNFTMIIGIVLFLGIYESFQFKHDDEFVFYKFKSIWKFIVVSVMVVLIIESRADKILYNLVGSGAVSNFENFIYFQF